MDVGLITDSLGHRPLEDVLDLARDLGLASVEIATGNWSEAPHVDLADLVTSEAARQSLAGAVADRGLRISALNANGNQLHPTDGERQLGVLRDTIVVAGRLGVPTVVCMSGLPAGAPGDTTPNWVTSSWPPENLAIERYQWDDVAIPAWRELAAFAGDHGVRLAIEACFDQLVFNASTLLRLVEAAGPDVVGANLDPSHLMAMGADIPSVIRALGPHIFHVHAKDTRLDPVVVARDGLPTSHPMERAHLRSWNYVTLGLGHPGGERFWADFVYSLRAVGYDGPLNIEHEDVLMNSTEGVTRAARLLQRVVPTDAPDWRPADI
jgi:sugar phosphate isomerase/epimerase